MTAAVLDHLWQSTLVALGAWLLTLACRKARAGVRYGVWLAASVKFLVPFAALAAIGRLLAPDSRPVIDTAPVAAALKAAQPFSETQIAAPAIAHAASGFDWTPVLLLAWALGSAAIAVALMAGWSKVRSAIRSASPVAWPAPMPVLGSPSMLEPGLVGLWRPVLILPLSLFEHLGRPEIDAIVAHEACHMRRYDNLTAAIHTLAVALFWFHPMVWWIGSRLLAEREQACDEAVVRAGHDRAAYARGLIESCRLYFRSPLPFVAGASGSTLSRRVEWVMTAPASSPLPLAGKVLLVAAGLCAIASPVAAGWLVTPAAPGAPPRIQAVAAVLAPAARFVEARPVVATQRPPEPIAASAAAAPPEAPLVLADPASIHAAAEVVAVEPLRSLRLAARAEPPVVLAAAEPSADALDEIVCSDEPVTGSRFVRRTCTTRDQRMERQRELDRMQRSLGDQPQNSVSFSMPN